MGLLKRVYYPGSGKDLDTLKFILSDFKYVEDIFYCDYLEHLSVEDLANLSDWELIKEIPLTPADFRKEHWDEFWYNHEQSAHIAQPNQMASYLYILLHKKSYKVVRFYQLASEGAGTYEVICKAGYTPNIIFLADADQDFNWFPNIWGEPLSYTGRVTFLQKLALRRLGSVSRFIMVDEKTTNPWNGFEISSYIQHTRWSLYI